MKNILMALVALAALASCGTLPAADSPDVTAIVGATVVHPERDGAAAVAADQTLVIADGRIQAVGPAATTPVPKGARRIDGRGKWVIPGLIDAHVHFFQSGNLYTRPDGADFNRWMPYAKEDARNKARLPATFKVWLASGVTSVVDIGGSFWNFEMRDAARASPAAPRVAVAGPLISMVDRVKLDLGDPPIVKTASAEEAHAAGVPLAVHATELVTAKAAMRAGADYLVHSVEDEPIDDEFLALAKKNRILYCPTLFVTEGYQYALSGTWQATEAERRLADPRILAAMDDLRKMPKEMIPERVAALMSRPPQPKASPIALANLRKVWDAGITVVMGTDAGNIGTLHGPSVFREMEAMTQAGLTPLQVLRSATVNGASAMRMDRDLGTIAPGRLADLVILDADPLRSIDNLSRASVVIRGGKVFTPAALMSSLDAER
jgi:imidazolonepropionase-like amidohydrolase